MNFWDFAIKYPLTSLIGFYILVRYSFKFWKSVIRHLNIRQHGWPPPHCDADGDFKPDPDPSDNEPGLHIKGDL